MNEVERLECHMNERRKWEWVLRINDEVLSSKCTYIQKWTRVKCDTILSDLFCPYFGVQHDMATMHVHDCASGENSDPFFRYWVNMSNSVDSLESGLLKHNCT